MVQSAINYQKPCGLFILLTLTMNSAKMPAAYLTTLCSWVKSLLKNKQVAMKQQQINTCAIFESASDRVTMWFT